MKFILTGVLFALISQGAWAGWSCTATCNGSSDTVLSTLPWQANAGESSDFRVNCTQILGGTIGTTSPSYCGAYYYCYKTEQSSSSVSGSGEGLMEARKATRSACESANFDNHSGDGCPYSYHKYFLDEDSFSCSQ